ncbi:phosphoribosyltransferase family protein [Priestia aryabhattai]|uniref:phosphoribosyltransferase family protein n=1 Tax=Priestia aryabhattai TaxID=412384 RepID=UPI003D26E771
MNYLELSISDTQENTKKLANEIEKDFIPDVIIFISKGSFVIGKTFSEYFNIPLVEIFAVREGNRFKDLISPILKIIPKKIKKTLRQKELKSGIHNKNSSRKVYLQKGENYIREASNILVVDDSVDTGHTAKQVCEYIKSLFQENKTIKFASLNYFEESKEVYKVDYSLYKNSILVGPWSKDSLYYRRFLEYYSLSKNRGEF